MIEFIFMLTQHDATIPDALAILERVRDTGLRYVGFKDVGATPSDLAAITDTAHELSFEVMLEVVSTSVAEERASLEAAPEIGVDWVLGGTHVDDGVRILSGSGAKYCPFPGRVEGHPSVLHGELEEIADDARRLTRREGVHGVDLLAYRHPTVDPAALTTAVVEAADGAVIAAGSVAGYEQIRALEGAGAWGFTIGSAIFEGRLPGGPDVAAQVSGVLRAVGGDGDGADPRRRSATDPA